MGIAYVNRRYVPRRSAMVSAEDRGFVFADGVYEVIAVCNGRYVDGVEHLDRLERSLAALEIAPPMARRALELVIERVRACNDVADGMVYLQITRGVAPRAHPFPDPPVRPSLFIMAKALPKPTLEDAGKGVSVITTPDSRWRMNEIKAVSLLANVMNKQKAVTDGAYEAWMVDNAGYVTEATASTAWIVGNNGVLATRPLGPEILPGVTRARVIALAQAAGIDVQERPFTPDEAAKAAEAFLTGTTSLVKPVVAIDGIPISDGEPGPLTLKLLSLYLDYMESA